MISLPIASGQRQHPLLHLHLVLQSWMFSSVWFTSLVVLCPALRDRPKSVLVYTSSCVSRVDLLGSQNPVVSEPVFDTASVHQVPLVVAESLGHERNRIPIIQRDVRCGVGQMRQLVAKSCEEVLSNHHMVSECTNTNVK